MEPTNKTDAVRQVEEMLGSEGSLELATAIVDRIGWRDVVVVAQAMGEREWGKLVDSIAAALKKARGE